MAPENNKDRTPMPSSIQRFIKAFKMRALANEKLEFKPFVSKNIDDFEEEDPEEEIEIGDKENPEHGWNSQLAFTTPEGVLDEITTPLSDCVDVPAFAKLRDNFQTFLTGYAATILIGDGNALDYIVTDIVKFFFSDVMSVKGLCHVRYLIVVHNIILQHGVDLGLAARMELPGRDTEPLHTLGFFLEHLPKRHLSHGSKRWRQLVTNISEIKAVSLWNQIENDLKNKDGELRLYLRTHDFNTGRGRSWSERLIERLTKELRVPRKAFTRIMDESQCVHALVTEFGPGILCLLPEKASHRMNGWGLQKLRIVLPALTELVPELLEMSNLLRHNIYEPIMADRRATMKQAKVSSENKSLLTWITQAVVRGGGDPEPWNLSCSDGDDDEEGSSEMVS